MFDRVTINVGAEVAEVVSAHAVKKIVSMLRKKILLTQQAK